MKVAFLLCICSLQISAEVLSNITTGRNLLLETPDSIESSQSLETTTVPPELVHGNGQRVYGSTIDDDYDDDVEGELFRVVNNRREFRPWGKFRNCSDLVD